MRVKPGTQVTFTNVGDHAAHGDCDAREWKASGTPVCSPKGESKTITFDKPGTYYYICTPHPWMYGQVIVEP